jgi:Tfp pilus assembly protein PilV
MKIKNHKNLRRAFSLLEVMVAIGIFFLGAFAILTLVSQSLSNAQRMKHPLVDASAILAQLSLPTNGVIEGDYSGSLGDLLGKNYAGYNYQGRVVEIQTNGLCSADFWVFDVKNSRDPVARTSTLLIQKAPGSLDGGNFIK